MTFRFALLSSFCVFLLLTASTGSIYFASARPDSTTPGRLFQVMHLPNGEVFDPEDYPALMAPRRGAGAGGAAQAHSASSGSSSSSSGGRGLASLLTWRADSKS
jgi:hypothetical protein